MEKSKIIKPYLWNLNKFVLVSFTLTEIVLGKSTYLVSKKDTLSNIIYTMFGSPLYGPRGRLKEVISLNPHLMNPDLIRPGDVINLPSDYGEVISTHERKETKPKMAHDKIQETDTQQEPQNLNQKPFQLQEIGKLNFRAGIGGVEIKQYDKFNKLNSSVISNTAYFFNLGMDQKWSENNSFNVSWDIGKIDIAQPEGTPIAKRDILLSKFSATYFRNISDKWKLGVKTEIGQLPLLQRKDEDTLKVERPWIPVVSPTAIYKHKINRFYEAGIEGNFGYVFPAIISSKQTNSGYGYELRPYLSTSLRKFEVWTEGSWSERNFSDRESEVNFRELKFMVGIKFPLLEH